MTREGIAELAELYGFDPDEVLLADGLDGGFIGFTDDGIAVYSRELCVNHMMETQGWDAEETWEFLEFNTFCAYVGPKTPLFIHFFNWEGFNGAGRKTEDA